MKTRKIVYLREIILIFLAYELSRCFCRFAESINDILLYLLNDVKSEKQLSEKTAVNKLAIEIVLYCKIVNTDVISNILQCLALSNFGHVFADGGHQNEQKVSYILCLVVYSGKHWSTVDEYTAYKGMFLFLSCS